MTKKRQPSSSVVSVMEDETLDLQDIDEEALDSENDSVSYMNMDISTDNIEDIVTSKMGSKMNMDDIYMISDEPSEESSILSDFVFQLNELFSIEF